MRQVDMSAHVSLLILSNLQQVFMYRRRILLTLTHSLLISKFFCAKCLDFRATPPPPASKGPGNGCCPHKNHKKQ
jgi:hypothetical protein